MLACFESAHAEAAVVFLTNGDRLTGEVIHANDEAYIFKSEALGTIAIKKPFIDQNLSQEALKDVAAARGVVKEKPEEAKPKIWDGRISAGFNRTRGNVKNTELTGGFLFHRKEEKKNEFHLKGDSYYSENDRKMNSQKHSGVVRFAYSFGESKKWYNFYKTEADRGEYRLKFDTAGVVQISEHFALRVSWINEYNSDPGPDTKEHGMYLTSALEYTF